MAAKMKNIYSQFEYIRGPPIFDPAIAPNRPNISEIARAIPLICVGYKSTTNALTDVIVVAHIKKQAKEICIE